RKLLRARLVWCAAVATGAVFLVGLTPGRVVQIAGLAADNADGLAGLGLSETFFVRYLTTLDLLLVLVFAVAGIVLFLRKSDNWLSILVSVCAVVQGVAMIRPEDSFGVATPGWRAFAIMLRAVPAS